MDKEIRLLNYKDEPKTITIKDIEKVKVCLFEIKSGDGVLTVIYNDKIVVFDSSQNRIYDFNDGNWFISPEQIDVLNKMKTHDDTDILDEVVLDEEQ